jgi:hypothetical protein
MKMSRPNLKGMADILDTVFVRCRELRLINGATKNMASEFDN